MKRSMVLLVAGAALLSACGSGDKSSGQSSDGASTTAAVVADAQENAVVSAAVCYSWPNGTTDAQPCAVGLKGPGGGRVFYDAGSVQSWGRFLEVAPQNWNGTLVSCSIGLSSCGAAEGIDKVTSDGGAEKKGYLVCGNDSQAARLSRPVAGEAGNTATAIGSGSSNTAVVLTAADCTNSETTAVTLAAGYRGGGLSDWYLPSKDELVALCNYDGRNAIGGFVSDAYASSSSHPEDALTTEFAIVTFGQGCDVANAPVRKDASVSLFVRPIRAFA